MANSCNTEYCFCGSKNSIEQLRNVLEKSNEHFVYLGDVLKEFGLDEKRYYHRGDVVFCDHFCDGDDYYLKIITDTAWVGCHDMFFKIRNLIDEDMLMSYREIECGCDIFNTYDEFGYFTEECCVDYDGELFGECGLADLFDTKESAIEFWCENVGYQWDKKTTSVEEMLKIIDKYQYEDDDTFFFIHEFTWL